MCLSECLSSVSMCVSVRMCCLSTGVLVSTGECVNGGVGVCVST